jgi:pimeloyl-ACP methyl ester carboxylesterase
MSTYVLVHGAAHCGDHFETCAETIRAAGHTVYCPTLAGNRPGDDPSKTGLDDAIDSLVAYFDAHDITDAVLVGHSWGGFAITGAADRLAAGRVRRLVYFSAFVPNDGESLLDLVPPHYRALFEQMGEATGAVGFPFPILREAFINDGSLEQAQELEASLCPHPYCTMADPIRLSKNPAEFEIGKSYLLATEDTALPASMGWHPRLSERLGLFRFVTLPGSHSVHFTNPQLLGQKIIEAGRD